MNIAEMITIKSTYHKEQFWPKLRRCDCQICHKHKIFLYRLENETYERDDVTVAIKFKKNFSLQTVGKYDNKFAFVLFLQ